jgi:tRNA G10  N-methylase Trm11
MLGAGAVLMGVSLVGLNHSASDIDMPNEIICI